MSNKELGSEFSEKSYNSGVNEYFDLTGMNRRFVLSGRTALHLVALELKNKHICSIALPDYLCGTMVQPFYDEKFTISFYESGNMGKIQSICKSSAVLIMDYFGFLREETVNFASQCRDMGKTIIVDATQTAFSKSKLYELADYIIVSYRKWFDCLCAAVYSKKDFVTPDYQKKYPIYVDTWRIAANKKRQYIHTGEGSKDEYLRLYFQANAMLNDYQYYSACDSEKERLLNCNSRDLIQKRRLNAKYLIDSIKSLNNSNIELMFEDLKTEDCPLFVPVKIKKHRNVIKNELINRDIYCPSHWPINKNYPYKENILYEQELSLICDQRYSIEDMEMQINVLAEIFNKHFVP